jgi:endogenous inhibitor of DNA gyrase (YacG/DUF329 family)
MEVLLEDYKRICQTCGVEFNITQFQKKKIFCSGQCTNGWYGKTNSKYRKSKK